MQPLISIQNLEKRYRDCEALAGVSLEVPPGVVFALLGENGAGKTTMIKCLTGFEQPTAGSAKILGLDCHRDALEIRRRIGYVSDQPALYDWMRIDEIGWFTAAFYPTGYLKRYHELIAHYELPVGRKIRQLSKGQRAKVALSLAIAHDPDLLILDEPTSGLDPVVRRHFLESMVDRAAVGKTVFLSSHQINEVERVADHVALMKQGRLIHCEALESLKAKTRELQINVTDTGIPVPLVAANVISADRTGRQWRLLVRDVSEAQLAQINGSDYVTQVIVHEPSLEEIFVGYIGCERPVAPEDAGASPSQMEQDSPEVMS